MRTERARAIVGGRTAGMLLLAALLLVEQAPALAKKEATLWEETDRLPAVQNRLYRMEHEFAVGIGVLPVDAFYKGLELTGAYNWHINDLWAVGVRGTYLKNVKTSLRDKLENNFGEPSSKFAEVLYYGELGAMFKPIYGKLSFLNKTLVYGEIYLSLGAVVARLAGGTATDDEPQGKAARMAFGGSPGFGIRGYFTERLSVRFDFRYLLLYSAGEGHYPLSLTLNFAFTTRSDR